MEDRTAVNHISAARQIFISIAIYGVCASAVHAAPPAPPGSTPPPTLAGACRPDPTRENLRICSLTWLLHLKTKENTTVVDKILGVASDAGKLVGSSLDPFGVPLENPHYGVYAWKKPTTGEWAEYVFCNYKDENVLKIPKKHSNRVSWGWDSQKSDGWQFHLSVREADVSRGEIAKGHAEVKERIYYVMVHKNDRQKAIDANFCAAKAPND